MLLAAMKLGRLCWLETMADVWGVWGFGGVMRPRCRVPIPLEMRVTSACPKTHLILCTCEMKMWKRPGWGPGVSWTKKGPCRRVKEPPSVPSSRTPEPDLFLAYPGSPISPIVARRGSSQGGSGLGALGGTQHKHAQEKHGKAKSSVKYCTKLGLRHEHLHNA